MSSFNRRGCFKCGGPFGSLFCRQCTCERCRRNYMDEVYSICCVKAGNSFVNDPNSNSFNDSPKIFNHPPQPQMYSYELCGNDSHHGYDCPLRFPLVYEQEPSHNQNFSDNYCPQNSSSFPQQYLCCTRCGGPHESYQCQLMNQNYYDLNLGYNSNSFGFDQYQPPQYSVTHQPPQEKSMAELLLEEKLPQALHAFCEKLNKYVQEKQEEKNNAEEQAAKVSSQYWKPPIYYDDDNDDEESSIPLRDIISELPLVEDLVLIPSESDDLSDNKNTSIVYSPKIDSLLEEFAGELAHIDLLPPKINEADFDPEEDIRLVEQLLYDNSPPLDALKDHFEIFFNYNDDCTSSDDNPFYSEDIDYVEASPPDSELVSLEEVKDFDPEDGETDTNILLKIKDDILREKLLNINLLIAKIESLKDNPTPSTDFVLKSPSSFPIPVEDSDFFLEKSKTFLSLPELETFRFDIEEKNSGSTTIHADISLLEYDCFYFEIEPELGELTRVVVEDISDNSTRELRVYVPNILPTLPTLYPVFDTLLPFSSENEDKVFNPGILISKEEKSPHLLSHRGFKVFQLINDSESPMIIYRGDIPILDVPYLFSILLDQINYGGSSQAQDSVNKNKRFSGDNPCLFFFLFS
ncbi:hypothetical protein Tco_0517283 [Tanacetum coccineum]